MADCNEKKENAPSEIMKKAEEFLASKRKIFLWGGVDDESAERIVKELLYLDSLNHEDIYFFGTFIPGFLEPRRHLFLHQQPGWRDF